MKRKLIIISLVLSLSAVSALSFAREMMGPESQRGQHGGRGMMPPMMMHHHPGPGMGMPLKLLKKAGVSEAKIEKIRSLMFEMEEKNAVNKVKERHLGMQLFAELHKLQYDKVKIKDLSTKLIAVKDALMTSRLDYMLKMMDVLDQTERKKVMDLMKEFRKGGPRGPRFDGHGGRGFRRGPRFGQQGGGDFERGSRRSENSDEER